MKKSTKKTNTVTIYQQDYIDYLRFRGFNVPDDSKIGIHTTFECRGAKFSRYADLEDVVNGINVTWTTFDEEKGVEE